MLGSGIWLSVRHHHLTMATPTQKAKFEAIHERFQHWADCAWLASQRYDHSREPCGCGLPKTPEDVMVTDSDIERFGVEPRNPGSGWVEIAQDGAGGPGQFRKQVGDHIAVGEDSVTRPTRFEAYAYTGGQWSATEWSIVDGELVSRRRVDGIEIGPCKVGKRSWGPVQKRKLLAAAQRMADVVIKAWLEEDGR